MDKEELKFKALKRFTRDQKKDRRCQSEQTHKVKKKSTKTKYKPKWDNYLEEEEYEREM